MLALEQRVAALGDSASPICYDDPAAPERAWMPLAFFSERDSWEALLRDSASTAEEAKEMNERVAARGFPPECSAATLQRARCTLVLAAALQRIATLDAKASEQLRRAVQTPPAPRLRSWPPKPVLARVRDIWLRLSVAERVEVSKAPSHAFWLLLAALRAAALRLRLSRSGSVAADRRFRIDGVVVTSMEVQGSDKVLRTWALSPEFAGEPGCLEHLVRFSAARREDKELLLDVLLEQPSLPRFLAATLPDDSLLPAAASVSQADVARVLFTVILETLILRASIVGPWQTGRVQEQSEREEAARRRASEKSKRRRLAKRVLDYSTPGSSQAVAMTEPISLRAWVVKYTFLEVCSDDDAVLTQKPGRRASSSPAEVRTLEAAAEKAVEQTRERLR